MALLDVIDDGGVLGVLGAVDEIGLVQTHHRSIGRDGHDAQRVDLLELVGLGHGRAGHARELVVEAEVVLESDRGQGLVLRLDLHALLGLDGLVESLVVAPALEEATGVLIDDENLTVEDDVVAVLLEEFLGSDGVVEESDERSVDHVVEVVDAELVLNLVDGGFKDADRLLLLVHLVVLVDLEETGDSSKLGVPLGGLVGRSADDERSPSLVDEDGVDLIDHGEVVPALDHLGGGPGHVVAQVVEAELVVGPVGDVRRVGLATLRGRHVRQDDAHVQAQEAMDAAHPLGIALGEVVVDGDDMHALAGECIEIRGQRGDEGLALTRAHLGDVAQMQRPATHELDVVVALTEGAACRLAHRGEGLGEEVVEGLTVVQPGAVLSRQAPQLLVGHGDEVVLDGVDLLGDALEGAERLSLARAEDLVQDAHQVILDSPIPLAGPGRCRGA